MKKFLMALTGASILVLGACGGGADPEPAEEPEAPMEDPAEETPAEDPAEEPAADSEAAGDYDAVAAQESYQANGCAGCHGGNFEGGAFPSLEGLSYDEIVTAIQVGGGPMQPNIVEGDEAANLSAWIADNN